VTEKNNMHIARVTKKVNAPVSEVWDALVSPQKISRYMMGTEVRTDWQPGSEIVWEGEWEGKPYQDRGTILTVEPEHRLSYSHFSPMSSEEDISDNYHIVDIDLSREDDATRIELTQDNNRSDEARQHSEENWSQMLDGLKEMVEKG
jgi:uncharacterized protein YndB with AHSA1/START domain